MTRLFISFTVTTLMVLLALSPALPAAAQGTTPSTPAIDTSWWTIDGGGAQMTTGIYTIRATLGQPDAGRVAANWYELRSGYWSGATIRHPRTYLPLLLGYLDIEHQVTYGQITIIALGLILIATWRKKRSTAIA